MKFDLTKTPTFGVAGNFTGHLEQAGEASDFTNIKTAEECAPKAIFPTYIPVDEKCDKVPEYLKEFPFADDVILYPVGQDKLQIEPECAVLFDVTWDNGKVSSMKAVAFGASNDCSIRREGARKISIKKNWGPKSKGFSSNAIAIDSFTSDGNINDYRIASYLVRDGKAFPYGEDSAIRDYSYVYDKLINWMIDKFNNQIDEGPAENINEYLNAASCPERILVSIGATRYTEYGETNFLRKNDNAVVILYPESKYTSDEITNMLLTGDIYKDDISVLNQTIIEEDS